MKDYLLIILRAISRIFISIGKLILALIKVTFKIMGFAWRSEKKIYQTEKKVHNKLEDGTNDIVNTMMYGDDYRVFRDAVRRELHK
ncbi:MAG: hypothetical protein LKI80_16895 [Sporolactobacillus sp.]|nr:hypothetical protein [Sporolactobacillus sp.]